MFNIKDKQCCPYCEYTYDDYESCWEFEGDQEFECPMCNKVFASKPQYEFVGWIIEKKCDVCEEWSEDGELWCDCDKENET